MIYNTADQLTLWPGMYSYLYDNNGALTRVKSADGAVTRQSFTYDPTGLMNVATFQGGTIANTWDADERRVKFTTGGQDYKFIFDPTAGIPAVLVEQTPGDHISYFREPNGELIAMSHPSFGLRYYHFDELGSTRLITDEYGEITDRYIYDAYGSVLSHDSNTGSVPQPYQYVGRLGYYTHYMQPEFGWLQLGVRFYEPDIGRFERRDPVVGVAAGYHYAEGSPMLGVDPSGETAVFPGEGAFPLSPAMYLCFRNIRDDAEQRMAQCYEKERRRARKPGELPKSCDLLYHCWAACRIKSCTCTQDGAVGRFALWLMDRNHPPGTDEYERHKKWNHYGYGLKEETAADCLGACYAKWKEQDYGRRPL